MSFKDPVRRREYLRGWVAQNKEKVKKARLDYMQKLRTLVYDHYGRKCACCGETKLKFLSVDHKLNNGADERKQGFVSTMLNVKIVRENYPSTYQILCMNCNFGKMRNNGVCPHVC